MSVSHDIGREGSSSFATRTLKFALSTGPNEIQSCTFLVNHMPDGSELVLDMAFFEALEGVTREQGEAILAAAG
jgi:hypothetical protein